MILGIYIILISSHFAFAGKINNDDLVESKITLMDLPPEMLLTILDFLDAPELGNMQFVNKEMNELIVGYDRLLWKKLAESKKIKRIELRRIQKGFLTFRQYVKGFYYGKIYDSIRKSDQVSNDEKLFFLELAAENGIENWIDHYLCVYCLGLLGLDAEDQKTQEKGLALVKRFADTGSKVAIYYLYYIYEHGKCGLKKDNETQKEGLKILMNYAEQDSRMAVKCLIRAFKESKLGLHLKDEKLQKFYRQLCEKQISYMGKKISDELKASDEREQ